MSSLLKEAKEKFKKGDLFLSATGSIKSPMRVNELKVSLIHSNTIFNESGGVIVMEEEFEDENGVVEKKITWAKKVEQ
jgi:hypothetical protein